MHGRLAPSWIVLLVAAGAAAHSAAAEPATPAGDPLPPFARLQLGSKLFRHPTNVVDMAVAPDERLIATVGEREVVVWDAATGAERQRFGLPGLYLPAAAYGQRPVVFTPDGKLILVVIGDTIVRIDSDSFTRSLVGVGRELGPFERPPANQRSRSIDVSPDGQKYATGGERGLTVCDAEGAILFEIASAPQAVDVDAMNRDRLLFGGAYALGRFSPDGGRLAVVASDDPKSVKLVDAESGELRLTIPLAEKLVRMAFTPDGGRLIATERDSAIRAYDLASGRRLWERVLELTNPFENYTSAVACSPDGATIAVAATDNLIRLLDAATGEVRGELAGHSWYPWAVAFSRDGQTLYSSGWDGPIRRWDLRTRRQLPLPGGAVRGTGVAAYAPDGRRIAFALEAEGVSLVDAATGEETARLAIPGGQLSQLRFSPDGRRLAAGGAAGDQVLVLVWDLASGAVLRQWTWPQGRDPHADVQALAFTPRGDRLAAAVFRQSRAVVWDLAEGGEVARLPHQQVYGLDFTADGEKLITVGWDSILRVWSAADGRQLRQVVTGRANDLNQDLRMYGVACSPDGQTIATAHMNNHVWIWDARELVRRRAISVQGSFGWGAMAFSPDSLWLAVGLRGGAVSVWDPQSGERAWQPGAHQDTVSHVSFGRDSRTILSGGDDGLSYLWDVAPGESRSDREPEQLWSELAGMSSRDAYRAFWELARGPEEAVPLLAEKLRPVATLVDLDADEPGLDGDEARRRRRLQQVLLDKDPTVMRQIVGERAVAALVEARTPAAAAVLAELAHGPADSDLTRLAAAALRRCQGAD